MATSAEAWFGLVTAESEGRSIRPDIAYDAEGNETTSPTAALAGALRVFDRSYKGSHLALMIELLAGAMTGAPMMDKKESKSWGSLVIAIDPAEFSGTLEEFQVNAMVMCDRVKNAKRLAGVSEIMLPGERGDEVEARNIERGSVEISEKVYEKLKGFLEAV
jgi:LDH2 family malate/lactate/ureidoglycolate dehydrogenase